MLFKKININKISQWNGNKYIQVMAILLFVFIYRGIFFMHLQINYLRVFLHKFACQTKFSCIDRVVFRKNHFSNYPVAQSKWGKWLKSEENHFKGCRNGQIQHSNSLVLWLQRTSSVSWKSIKPNIRSQMVKNILVVFNNFPGRKHIYYITLSKEFFRGF